MFGMSDGDRQMIVEMHSSQIEMCTDMKWMKKKLREADSEEGYKRCVTHKAAVATCQEDVEDMRKSFRWMRNVSVTGLIGVVTVGCAAAANFVLGK